MQILKDKQSDFYFALAHLPGSIPTLNPVGRHFRESLQPATTAPKPNVPDDAPETAVVGHGETTGALPGAGAGTGLCFAHWA